MDHPNARKQHRGAVPLTGGIAIFLSFLAGTFALDIAPYSYPMLVIACMVFVVGVFDDIRHINATVRLFIQYGSGIALATYGGIAITAYLSLLCYSLVFIAHCLFVMKSQAIGARLNARKEAERR